MAKLILAFITKGQNYHAIVKGVNKPVDSNKPHYTIPTTPGTGSESTLLAEVYLKKNKYSL